MLSLVECEKSIITSRPDVGHKYISVEKRRKRIVKIPFKLMSYLYLKASFVI